MIADTIAIKKFPVTARANAPVYAPTAKNSPWAKLTTPIKPNTRVNPMAIIDNIRPQEMLKNNKVII
jgi:hypothetical protein